MRTPPPTRIILCDGRGGQCLPAHKRDEVLAAALDGDVELELVEDLCRLAGREDPVLGDWAEDPDTRIVACHTRGVKWLFHAAGAPLPDAEARVVPLRALPVPRALAALGLRPAGALAAAKAAEARAAMPTADDDWPAWFPVLDYDRCAGCGQCAAFCLFGVFDVADGGIRVASPANCKTFCPACARVCPQAAVIFPKYPSPPFDGADVDEDDLAREHGAENFKEKLRGDVYQVLRQRSGETAAAHVTPTPADLSRLAGQLEIPPEAIAALRAAGFDCDCLDEHEPKEPPPRE